MNRIRVLPETISRRLAAGEVIIRPASAVKELIENSLDAGAKRIAIELRSGGRSLIRVSDNGSGMSRDDLRLSIFRHSTSKLAAIDDLSRIQTYGFRGEALASIAAVSRLRIETCDKDGAPGTFVQAEAGEIKEIGDIARPRGTTVTVQALFFNLPVRRGFLKSDSYEVKLVLEVVKQYALLHTDVHFALRSNGEELLVVPPLGSLKDRLNLFLDDNIVENLVELHSDHPMLRLQGHLLSQFQVSGAILLQQIFINRRPVRNRTIVRAVYDGYGTTLRGGNPTFLLIVETAPENLDVNIHPTKQEVKFIDERLLYDMVRSAVRKTLGIETNDTLPAQTFALDSQFFDADSSAQPFWQLHSSYVFAQVKTGYCIIDQHAAHERILFEEAMKGTESDAAQGLLFPLTIELAPEEYVVYGEIQETLSSMGIASRPMSGRTVIIETLPAGANMTRDEIREIFAELSKMENRTRNRRDELAKAIACRGAVKAGQKLSQTEMESLINRLFACKNPFFCPHGRPAVIKITADDLAKRFGRT